MPQPDPAQGATQLDGSLVEPAKTRGQGDPAGNRTPEPPSTQGRAGVVFVVTLPASQDPVVIVHATDREAAKRAARPHLQHDPDRYIVQPITRRGAEVHVIAATPSTVLHCSLCDLVEDEHGKLPTVPTKGGWVAHEACVRSCESVRA